MLKKNNGIDKILFLLSPILSFPFVIYGIYKNNKSSIVLFCLILSIMSYGFISGYGNDKSYYIYLYKEFELMSFHGFLEYILDKADFIFYILIYIFSLLKIPFDFFSMFVTFLTLYIIFIGVCNFLENYEYKNFFIPVSFVILSLSIPDLFSGMRNYLSIAFIFYSLSLLVSNNLNIKNRYAKIYIFMIMGVLTHFSSIVYLLVFLCFRFANIKIIKLFFFLSLGFFFISKEFLTNLFLLFNFSDVYSSKIDFYVSGDGFIANSIEVGNLNNKLRILFNLSWFYLCLFFCFLNIKNNNSSFILLLCMMIFCNFAYSSVDLLVRYGLLVNLFFLLNVFVIGNFKLKNILLIVMFVVYFLSWIFNFMLMRDQFFLSYSNLNILTIPTMLYIDTTLFAGDKF